MDKSLILNKIKSHYKFKSDADFARFLGIDPRKYATWLHRKTFDLDLITTKCSDIDANWLLTGKGEMLKSSTEPQTEPKGTPLIPLEAFAGKGFELREGINFDTIEERYNVPLFKGLQVDFMIPVKGSSMYPKYASGDVVACRMVKDLLFIQWNKVYVIDSESQGTLLKRLKKSDNEDFVTCKSDNKDYEEFDIPKGDIRNVALVVGVIRLE